jgi:site-specific DNA recombinase
MSVATQRAHTNGGATAKTATRRVAIYTRQSVDRGDEYGSTQAQREAIEAYVASQRFAGWVAVDARYDDLGFSGSNTDRPGFQRLLVDVEAGRIDIIAVYKIDRLSRSLLDFTQLMKRFEEKGVEFVSVTQQFSTSTSVGRMTLNLLATFAQFERETIGERTRDKIAATRRRGRWTGGRPVLGYDAVASKLIVNEREAEQVRAIFDLYLKLGSGRAVLDELHRRGWRTKSWTNKAGANVAGAPFSKSTLHHLLRNVLYAGKITLGDEVFEAEHEAIVDAKNFDAVQARLRAPFPDRGPRRNSKSGATLLGLVKCRCGASMTSHFAAKGGKRYASYVCTTIHKRGAAACPGSRVPQHVIEKHVVDHVRAIGRDPEMVAETLVAARRQVEARRPALAAKLEQAVADRKRLEDERANLVTVAGAGGDAPAAIVERLAQVDRDVADLAAREQGLQAERVALDCATVDEADLFPALARFDEVWAALEPAERARALHLLIERIAYDGRDGSVAITFRANGLHTLSKEGADS